MNFGAKIQTKSFHPHFDLFTLIFIHFILIKVHSMLIKVHFNSTGYISDKLQNVGHCRNTIARFISAVILEYTSERRAALPNRIFLTE